MSAAADAIRSGDVQALKNLLREDPTLATARIDGSRTLLHVATDWPGHFPNGPTVVAILIEHGADVNAPFVGRHSETPLHWAASCDDIAVLDALLDRGANLEARGGVIGGGTPLSDAVAFGQWQAARRLVERGAQTSLWEAAAVGMIDRVEVISQLKASSRLRKLPMHSGARAMADNVERRNICSAAAQILTGWDTTS